MSCSGLVGESRSRFTLVPSLLSYHFHRGFPSSLFVVVGPEHLSCEVRWCSGHRQMNTDSWGYGGRESRNRDGGLLVLRERDGVRRI